MSDTPDPPAAKKKMGGVILALLAFVGGAAAGGGGAAMAVLAMGLGDHGGAASHTPEATLHPVEYIEIDNAFTSNLVDTGRYLQLRIAVSTTGGEPAKAALATHKPAIVSAVLAVLGEMGEADVADRKAKDKLRAAIKAAINGVLQAKAQIAGVDDVFFTSLVVQ